MKYQIIELGKILSTKDITRLGQGELRNLAKEINYDELLKFAKNNRVTPQVLCNLKKLKEFTEIDEEVLLRFEEENNIFINSRKAITNELARVSKCSDMLDHVVILKGFYLTNLYPADSPRYFRDVDIFMKDHVKYFHCVNDLHQLGHRLDWSMWLMKSDSGNSILGSGEWIQREADQIVNFDIHFGEYLFGYTRLDIDYVTQEFNFDNVGVMKHLSPEENIILLVSHAESHMRVMFRDINDMYVLISKFSDGLSWDYVMNKVYKNGLLMIFSVILDLAIKHYPDLSICIPKTVITELKRFNNETSLVHENYPYNYSFRQKFKSNYLRNRNDKSVLSSVFATCSNLFALIYVDVVLTSARNGKFENTCLLLNKTLKLSDKTLSNKHSIFFMSIIQMGFDQLIGVDLIETVKGKTQDNKHIKVTFLAENIYILTYKNKTRFLLTKDDIFLPGYFSILTEKQYDSISLMVDELLV